MVSERYSDWDYWLSRELKWSMETLIPSSFSYKEPLWKKHSRYRTQLLIERWNRFKVGKAIADDVTADNPAPVVLKLEKVTLHPSIHFPSSFYFRCTMDVFSKQRRNMQECLSKVRMRRKGNSMQKESRQWEETLAPLLLEWDPPPSFLSSSHSFHLRCSKGLLDFSSIEISEVFPST